MKMTSKEGSSPAEETDTQSCQQALGQDSGFLGLKVPFQYTKGPIEKKTGYREFQTGATRDQEDGKFDYEGFLSPAVLYRFAEYMHKHRLQKDGSLRDSDNWQKGIPLDVYMKSGFRHFFDWWHCHRSNVGPGATEEALCALMFNVMGYLYEYLKDPHRK